MWRERVIGILLAIAVVIALLVLLASLLPWGIVLIYAILEHAP